MVQTVDWPAYLVFFARVFVFLVFTASVFPKFRNIDTFVKTISNFRLLPSGLIKPIAWIFALLELLVVIAAFFGGRLLPVAFIVAVFLLMLFTGALISILARGLRTRCNCFGSSHRDVSIYDIARNVGIIVITLMGAFALFSENSQPTEIELILKIILALMSASLAFIVVKLDDLLYVLRPVSRT